MDSCKRMWRKLPYSYLRCTSFSDFWKSYNCLLKDTHTKVGKETGLTNHVERLNNTIRQRFSRFVRKTPSFFKKIYTKFPFKTLGISIQPIAITSNLTLPNIVCEWLRHCCPTHRILPSAKQLLPTFLFFFEKNKKNFPHLWQVCRRWGNVMVYWLLSNIKWGKRRCL